jgi:metal-responsive CopG/Arc/MetJ family transcriptional regulator
MLDVNFGKLAVDLSLEEKVMANGVLPGRTVPERSEVVTSMVHHLLNTGKWRKAVKLRFGEGRHLYDQTKGDFNSDLLNAVKPEDFDVDKDGHRSDREDASIEILLEHGQKAVVRDLAVREDLPAAVSEYLIYRAFDEPEFLQKLSALGERIQKKDPDHAYFLFLRAKNKPAIDRLYKQIIENFKLDNLKLVSEIIAGNYQGKERAKEFLSLVEKAIPLAEQDKNHVAGGKLYDLAANEGLFVGLSDKDIMRLGKLAVHDMGEWNLRDRPLLKLLWAQTNWETNPVDAYKIFVEYHEYTGKEVVQCAEKAFNQMFISNVKSTSREKVIINTNHLQEILRKTPETELNSREQLALLLSDRQEFLRLGKIYAKSNEESKLRKAYDLLNNAKIIPDAKIMDDVRAKLIQKGIKCAEERDSMPYFSWLEHNDKPGFEQVYEAFLTKWAGEAYEFAANWKDEQRVARARDIILERNPANRAIMFFRDNKDKLGYDRALEALTKEYNVPAEQVMLLVGSVEK